MKPLSLKVKFCRNFIVCAGIFIFAGSILIVLVTPAKWIDGLDMLGIAFMCFGIAGEVNRREGKWHQKAFAEKPEPVSSQEDANE